MYGASVHYFKRTGGIHYPYFSVADKARKVEQFDSVIDSLRGFEKLENISEISIEKKELNDANLEECVSLALEESVINTDHTLVTSITTSGGELLKDNIFLVDMPGLDGGYANLDNPIYETISKGRFRDICAKFKFCYIEGFQSFSEVAAGE